MPSRNSVKAYDVPAYYHLYNRGAGGQKIFLDAEDKNKFLSLFTRYLDPDDPSLRADGLPYDKYSVTVAAYCLMGNHFHILAYQEDEADAISDFIRSLCTAYTMYFNHKYKQSGHLFQGIYKASRIKNESYLLHITRYIHLNPRTYRTYKWSSIGAYLGRPVPSWLQPDLVSNLSADKYLAFLEDYQDKKVTNQYIKNQLAT